MSEEIKIITLGDIFKNIETEEKAFKFKDYIKDLQQKVEQLEKENKELKQPQVFIDCEDMEERYGRDLYEDYLKEKIEQLENIRKEAISYILANCEIIRHEKENVDEVGRVNGADLLNILNTGE